MTVDGECASGVVKSLKPPRERQYQFEVVGSLRERKAAITFIAVLMLSTAVMVMSTAIASMFVVVMMSAGITSTFAIVMMSVRAMAIDFIHERQPRFMRFA